MTPRFRVRRLCALVTGMFVVMVLPGSAAAHAELQRAIPADGETVTEPVTVVTGRYSQNLAADSSLLVLDATGATVATGSVDPNDVRRMLARPDAPLTNGTYTVRSKTNSSEDGEIDRATWTFTVAVAPSPPTSPPSSSVEPTPICTDLCPGQPSGGEPQTASPPAASPAPTQDAAPADPASGSGDVLLPIVAASVIVAIGAAFLLNRTRGRSS